METPEAQAVINGTSEETKEEEVKEEPSTCIIEILGIRKGEETNNDEEDGKSFHNIACCVDFSYRDKTAKKQDVGKKFVPHFKAWKALLNSWVNMSSKEI